MLVDEYHVTVWTGGQYPAAPPEIIMPTCVGFFIWEVRIGRLAAGLFYGKFLKIQSKTTACEERSFQCGVFFV